MPCQLETDRSPAAVVAAFPELLHAPRGGNAEHGIGDEKTFARKRQGMRRTTVHVRLGGKATPQSPRSPAHG
jgi:hypothetical protein